MSTRRLLIALHALLFLLFALAASAQSSPLAKPSAQKPLQLAPIPADSYELATGATLVPESPEQRAFILGLLEKARQNTDLHAPATPPFALKVSFTASGGSVETGSGEMEEDWQSPNVWRWSARMGAYAQVRIGRNGAAYDQNAGVPLPLRLHLLRSAIFWPVKAFSPAALLRFAAAKWQGADTACTLISGARGDLTPTPGRRWVESEYCVDAASGLLRTYSEAPGIYVVYDYQDALRFHGRVMPRTITIVEAGRTVLTARLENLQDLAADDSLFTVTPQMAAQGPGITVAPPIRFPMDAPESGVARGAVQPVIVLAEIGSDGKVLEAELLEDSPLGAAALGLVRGSSYPIARGGRQQRAAYINVRFVSAQ